MQNQNVQRIVEMVSEKLAQYTTNKSITPQVITETIALTIQSLYAPTDVFMSNNNVKEIDLSNYINVERLFANNNPFTSLDISEMVALKHIEFSAGKFVNKSIDFSNNTLLENVLIKDVGGFNTFDLSSLLELKNLSLNKLGFAPNNDVTSFSFLNNNVKLESLEIQKFKAISPSVFNANNFPLLKNLSFPETIVNDVDCSGLVNLESVFLYNTTNLNITGCLNIREIAIFSGLNITQSQIDNILNVLANNNVSNGSVNIENNPSVQPSSQGLIDKATLESRGWSVSIN